MFKTTFLALFAILFLMNAIAPYSFAQNQSVELIINEILPNPEGSDTGLEWLELYNYSADLLVLENLSLEFESLSGSKRSVVIDEITLDSTSYLVISNQDFAEFEELVVLSTISMYNDGGFVRLIHEGNILDEITYSSSSSGISYERNGYLNLATCNQMFPHPNSNTINAQNFNLNLECIESIDEMEINAQIILSIDNVNWYESIQTTGPVDLYFDIQTMEDFQSVVFKNHLGEQIEAPLHLDSLWDQKIYAEVLKDEKIFNVESEPVLIVNKDFRVNEVDIAETIQVEIFKPSEVDPNGFYLYSNGTQTDISDCFVLDFCVVTLESSLDTINLSINYSDLVIDNNEFLNVSTNYSYYLNEWHSDFANSIGSYNTPPINLLITEVYPSPSTNEKEQIEIFNNGNYDVSLSGMYIKDAGNGSDGYGTKYYYLPEIIINSYEYIVLDTANITLNNSGDTLALFSSSHKILDEVTYTSVDNATSCIRYFPYDTQQDLLEQTSILTLGSQNPEKFDPFGLSLTSINDSKKLDDETYVLVEGIVTVEPNLLGESDFYIQDSTGGIRVDLEFIQDFYVGQRLRIYGELDTKSTEREINLNNMQNFQLVSNNSTLEATFLNDIAEEEIGSLVKIKAEIVENYSTSFVLDLGLSNLKVSILSSTGIPKVDKSKGDNAEIIGVLSIYNGEYRLLPRYASDIKITKPISLSTSLNTLETSLNVTRVGSLPTTNLTLPSTQIYTQGSTLGQSTVKSQTQVYLWPIWLIFSFLCIITLAYKLTKAEIFKKALKEYMIFRDFTLNQPIRRAARFNDLR